MTDIRQTKIDTLLESQGWHRESIGQYRSNGQIKDIEGFILFVRRRPLKQFIDDFSKKSSLHPSENPCICKDSSMGSNPTLGLPKSKMTPLSIDAQNCVATSSGKGGALPSLSSFSDFPSLMQIRKDEPTLLIGYDSESKNNGNGREMLSWQYALVDGTDLVEFIFFKNGNKNLYLLDALGCILDHLNTYNPVDVRTIRKYKYCAEWKDNQPVEIVTTDLNEARNKCKYVYRSEIGFTSELIMDMPDRCLRRSDRDWSWFHTYLDFSGVNRIKVCFVCHGGKFDLSALDYGEKNLLCNLTEIQGTLVSLQPVRYAPKSLHKVNNTYVYPISLSVADTMCHAPAKKKKLEDLGKALGIEKIEISESQKKHMEDLLIKDPVLYAEYASTDSIVTLLYASALYGYNNSIPVTITSATARIIKDTMMRYLGCDSTTSFNRVYRGLERKKHGKFKIQDAPGFVDATSLEPISNNANTIQHYASQAYHGGYNTCTIVGYFPFSTYDYDLRNAYPTAMCLVPDINWENPIRSEVIRREMTLADFTGIGGINPITPFVGYVRFQFPESCKYPCIPVSVDGVPVYPLTSDGMDGVYAAGPYIWLALKLGATVYCDRGFFLNVLYSKDYSQESRSLASAVKQLVADRLKAKHTKGEKSLEELILKEMVSSGYGKTAQNVVQKTNWSAIKDLMEVLGCSAITNPVSAMMTTAIVQVELIAAQNQLQELGYMSCSVTTDGIITDCPEHILKSLDLYGLRKFMESSRIFLTGDPELWEIKHHQDDLVNFTTRGNVSLRCRDHDNYDGVCAHNSTKSGFHRDSYKDRHWLMTQVLSRTEPIMYTVDKWTSFRDLVHGKPFAVNPETRHVRMDFDMKRRPLRDSFSTDKVTVEGIEYEIAHFDTVPYRTIDEFRLYRDKKKLTKVLRTESDWDIFWQKLAIKTTGIKPRDFEWSILNSCIMGYRCGRWDIPGLADKTIDEKCEWINTHNTSTKKFKPSDWKNARRPERQANMLPLEQIREKLEELQNAQ